jgi:putative endonuclease
MGVSHQKLGQIGEDLAVAYLRDSGFVILDRNFRAHRVELDIVAREKNTLVFCEVKTRRTLQQGSPLEAITPVKMEHLRSAALGWLSAHHFRFGGMRFDAIGILIGADSRPDISHIRGFDQ